MPRHLLLAISVAAALLGAGGAGASFPGSNGLIVFSLDRNGTVDLYAVPASGGSPRRLTHSVPTGIQASASPDGARIAFLRLGVDGSNYDVWTMRRDGGGARQITETDGDENQPSFSPDGRLLAWRADSARLVVANADGSGRRFLPPRNITDYSWTPDGRLTYLAACRVRTIAPDGSDPQDVAAQRPCRGNGAIPTVPVWSLDGRLRAWSADALAKGELWIAGRDGAHARRVFAARRTGVDALGWLPDGELAFLVGLDEFLGDRPTAPLGLYTVRADGSGLHRFAAGAIDEASLAVGGRIVAAGASGDIVLVDLRGRRHAIGDSRQWFSPSWSADGRRLVLSSSDGLAEARADGSGIVRLTARHEYDQDPAFSPDGWSLVWSRNGRLVTMRIGSRPVGRLGVRGSHPHWSPDGRQILYSAGDSGRTRPTILPAAGGTERLAVSKREVRPYVCGLPTWSPDGKRIAFVIFRKAAPELDVAGADGTGHTLVAQDATAPVWSPDGREIAFVRGHELWTVDVDSKRERRLADVTGIQSVPDWQPVG